MAVKSIAWNQHLNLKMVFIGLIGPNGSGKSTIMNIMSDVWI